MIPTESLWSITASWVEAIGAIAAVVGSGWVAARDSRAARGREERAAVAAALKEAHALLATKTAALNLAILASRQIHDLHALLADDAWRGRVTRVSASRALLATERMLTSFPIQSLTDATAMVEFSRFPTSLAVAAEIYVNLETAVRAAPPENRAALFSATDLQMARLATATGRQLVALAKALGLDAASIPGWMGVSPKKGFADPSESKQADHGQHVKVDPAPTVAAPGDRLDE